MIVYYVYFARGYCNEEMVAECYSMEAARARADEEFANGSRDITVVTETGCFVYEPEEESLFDEF